VDGGEFLHGLRSPGLSHRSFSSPKWLVCVFGTIVEPPLASLIVDVADDFSTPPDMI